MLFEFHILQNHAPANLNRDDVGAPKSCFFGGAQRARISSQCLKRSIRKSETFERALKAASVPLGTRTRNLPVLVAERVEQALLSEGVEATLASGLAKVAERKATGFGNKDGKENEDAETAQTMFLTSSDVNAVAQVLTEKALEKVQEDADKAVKEFSKVKAKELQNDKSLSEWRPITVDVALFGRMITSPAFQDTEASMQVAHALSTHRVEMEFDYFTAVDDLPGPEDAGADMIGEIEFNSACFYKYFSLHLDGLLDNLTGDSGDRESALEIAQAVVPAFLEAAVVSTPSGKQNTFAAHNLPSAVLVEVRPHPQPVSYANAFADPVDTRKDGLIKGSVNALREHVEKTDKVFSPPTVARFWLSLDGEAPPKGVTNLDNLKALKAEIARMVKSGEPAHA